MIGTHFLLVMLLSVLIERVEVFGFLGKNLLFIDNLVFCFRIVWVLFGQILIVHLINQLAFVSHFLTRFFVLFLLHSSVCIQFHLPQKLYFLVFNEVTFSIHDSHFIGDATELVAKDAVDLITILRVKMLLVCDQFALQGDPHPIL